MNALGRAARGVIPILLAATALSAGGTALAQAPPAQSSAPAPEFGRPPSGAIPILFNDRHVYAKPDKLKQGRVLTAIVRNGTILIPLRSMFEQTGATVSFDPVTKTVEASKPGADVKVTVGKQWVTVNGEERPLDVPPQIVDGTILVPLRVMSESLGAYVQWVPEKRIVVIRYTENIPEPLPPTTPPPVQPSAAPVTPVESPTPTPAKRRAFERYVTGDYLIAPKVYNELSAGNTGNRSYEIKGDVEFPLFGPQWEIGANYRHVLYPHYANQGLAPCGAATGCTVVGGNASLQAGACPAADPGCVTTVGAGAVEAYNGLGQAYVTAFTAQEDDVDAHFGLKVLDPRVYIEVAGYSKSFNYLGYPRLTGVGIGLVKLPDLDQPFSLYGSAFYFPKVSGTYTYPTTDLLGPLSGSRIQLAYDEWKYEVGGTVALGSNLYVDFGYAGEKMNAKTNAPTGTTVNTPYVGLGLHF